jgi:hypothetical protein
MQPSHLLHLPHPLHHLHLIIHSLCLLHLLFSFLSLCADSSHPLRSLEGYLRAFGVSLSTGGVLSSYVRRQVRGTARGREGSAHRASWHGQGAAQATQELAQEQHALSGSSSRCVLKRMLIPHQVSHTNVYILLLRSFASRSLCHALHYPTHPTLSYPLLPYPTLFSSTLHCLTYFTALSNPTSSFSHLISYYRA